MKIPFFCFCQRIDKDYKCVCTAHMAIDGFFKYLINSNTYVINNANIQIWVYL